MSDLKELLILNDFSTVNDSCTQHISELAAAQAQNRAELETLYSQAAALAAGVAGQTANSAAAQPQQTQEQLVWRSLTPPSKIREGVRNR